MADMSAFMQALSALAWPIIVILVVVLFTPTVKRILESLTSRGFTVKVGGQELTVSEASEQQRKLITDLQQQVLAVKSAMDSAGMEVGTSSPRETLAPVASSVLWVNDQPKDMSYFIELLREHRIDYDIAISTADALQELSQKREVLVVSDIGRVENGEYVPDAGIKFLRAVRQTDPTIPFVFSTTPRGQKEHSKEASELNARVVTSPMELIAILQEATGQVLT